MLTRSKAKRFVDAGVRLFEIPLLTHRKHVFEYLTKSKNFEKTLRGIADASETEASVVCVFVATKHNIQDALNVAELSIALGAKALMFNRINPATKKHVSLMPSPRELEEALYLLDIFSAEHSFPIFCSIPIQPCIIDMNKFPNISHGFCPSAGESSYFTIDFFGNVRVCNHSPYILGNLLEKSLARYLRILT